MEHTYSIWEEQIIKNYNLPLNTVGTIMRLEHLKEETYLDYYYGDIALTILKRNLDNKNEDQIKEIVNDKSNYYKLFKNKNLNLDILTEKDNARINYDIVHYIKAILVSKSNNNKQIDLINKLSKGDYSMLTILSHNFKVVKKYYQIDLTSFKEEKEKLDNYYSERLKEIEDTEEYQRMIAKEWKESIIKKED